MLMLRSFVRRLLLQALVSSIVMAGIQVAVRFGPPILPTSAPLADATPPHAASPRTPASERSTDEGLTAPVFAQDRTHADVKSGRFAVWRERETPARSIAPERLASKGPGNGLSDVVLFDRCRPSCESQDPLLAFNQRPSTAASERPEPQATALEDVRVLPLAGTIEVGDDADTPRSDGGVAAAARGGLSWARRVVGTAGSAIGW